MGWQAGLASVVFTSSQAHSAAIDAVCGVDTNLDARLGHSAAIDAETATTGFIDNYNSALAAQVGLDSSQPFLTAKEFDRGEAGTTTIITPPSGGGGGATMLYGVSSQPIGGHRVVAAPLTDIQYANSSTLFVILGITTGSADAGSQIEIAVEGEIDEPTWNWTPGPVYVGVNGLLTQVAPSTGVVQQIGVALASTKILIRIGPAIKLI